MTVTSSHSVTNTHRHGNHLFTDKITKRHNSSKQRLWLREWLARRENCRVFCLLYWLSSEISHRLKLNIPACMVSSLSMDSVPWLQVPPWRAAVSEFSRSIAMNETDPKQGENVAFSLALFLTISSVFLARTTLSFCASVMRLSSRFTEGQPSYWTWCYPQVLNLLPPSWGEQKIFVVFRMTQTGLQTTENINNRGKE